MAIQIVHSYVSPVVDDGVSSEVGPNEWNEPHTITGTVDSTQIAAGGVAEANIATDAVTSTKIKDGAVITAKIAAQAVTSTEIKLLGVTAAQIATDTITSTQIATDGVASNEIKDGAVVAAKIATDTITSTQIAADAITSSELKDASVIYAKIQDASTGSVLLGRRAGSGGDFEEIVLGTNLSMVGTTLNAAATGATLSDGDYGDVVVSGTGTILTIDTGVVTSTKIATGGVATGNIAAGAVTSTELGATAVTTAKIAAQAVTSTEIKLLGVTAAQIANDTITSTQVAADAVTSSELKDGAVLTAKIATGAVTSTQLATDAVTSVKILDGAVQSTKIGTDAVTSIKILDGAVISTKLGSDSVVTVKILDQAVTSSKIINLGVTAGQIAANAVISTKIIDAGVTYAKIQDVSVGSVLLGRDTSGAGDVQEIQLGTNLSMVGSTLNASGGGSSALAAGVAGNIQFAGTGSLFQAEAALTWDSTSNILLVGASTAQFVFGDSSFNPALQVLGTSTDLASIGAIRYAADASPSRYMFGHSRGATIGAYDAVQSGDQLGNITFEGSDGTRMVVAANIIGRVASTVADEAMPGCLTFGTTPIGAAAATERFRVKHDGTFSFHANAIGAVWSTPASGDCLWGWDNSASTYTNMTVGNILSETAPTTGDFFLLYGAEGDVRKVPFANMPAGTGGGQTLFELTYGMP